MCVCVYVIYLCVPAFVYVCIFECFHIFLRYAVCCIARDWVGLALCALQCERCAPSYNIFHTGADKLDNGQPPLDPRSPPPPPHGTVFGPERVPGPTAPPPPRDIETNRETEAHVPSYEWNHNGGFRKAPPPAIRTDLRVSHRLGRDLGGEGGGVWARE